MGKKKQCQPRFNARHEALKNALTHLFRNRLGMAVHLEQRFSSGNDREGDLVVQDYSEDTALCIDTFVVSEITPSAIQQNSVQKPAAMVDNRENAKRRKYEELVMNGAQMGIIFQPFGMSTFGAFSKSARRIMAYIIHRYSRTHVVREREIEATLFSYVSSRVMSHMAQQILRHWSLNNINGRLITPRSV